MNTLFSLFVQFIFVIVGTVLAAFFLMFAVFAVIGLLVWRLLSGKRPIIPSLSVFGRNPFAKASQFSAKFRTRARRSDSPFGESSKSPRYADTDIVDAQVIRETRTDSR